MDSMVKNLEEESKQGKYNNTRSKLPGDLIILPPHTHTHFVPKRIEKATVRRFNELKSSVSQC